MYVILVDQSSERYRSRDRCLNNRVVLGDMVGDVVADCVLRPPL